MVDLIGKVFYETSINILNCLKLSGIQPVFFRNIHTNTNLPHRRDSLTLWRLAAFRNFREKNT